MLTDLPNESTAVLESPAVSPILELVRARVAELETKIARYKTARVSQWSRWNRAASELENLRPALAELERAERAHIDTVVASLLEGEGV
jgi:hypothetical protein